MIWCPLVNMARKRGEQLPIRWFRTYRVAANRNAHLAQAFPHCLRAHIQAISNLAKRQHLVHIKRANRIEIVGLLLGLLARFANWYPRLYQPSPQARMPRLEVDYHPIQTATFFNIQPVENVSTVTRALDKPARLRVYTHQIRLPNWRWSVNT